MWKIILGLFSLLLLISIIWRFLSSRRSIPCPTWLSWMIELDNPFSKINRSTTIIENLNIEPGMTILDVGCGPGRLTIPIAQKISDDGKVVAMDVQKGMLSRTRKKAHAANLTNIEFLNAGIGEGKLEHNRFDRALLITVLGEVPDQVSALKESFRALKPGGVLCVTEIIFDPHFQRRSKILRLGSAVGFEEKEVYGSKFAYTINFVKPTEEI